jgi:hypothetical protein
VTQVKLENGIGRLAHRGEEETFVSTPLVFETAARTEPFAHKNNKTLAETIAHRRYAGLAKQTRADYSTLLETRLGEFLVT